MTYNYLSLNNVLVGESNTVSLRLTLCLCILRKLSPVVTPFSIFLVLCVNSNIIIAPFLSDIISFIFIMFFAEFRSSLISIQWKLILILIKLLNILLNTVESF